MHLKKVWISEYKNLKNFTVEFDGESFIDIFVGKNGSGKSNFFEALLEIFHHLRYFEKVLSFSYEISFNLSEECNYKYDASTSELTLNGHKAPSPINLVLPDQVLVYYSGHNARIPYFINEQEKRFKGKIKSATKDDSPFFISLTDFYKELFLALLLILGTENNREYLFHKLGIADVGDTLTIKLRRPAFATGRLKELGLESVDIADDRSYFWGAQGIVGEFLKLLRECIKTDYSHAELYDRSNDRYSISVDRKTFKEIFADRSLPLLVQYFDNLFRLDMLEPLSIELTLQDGTLVDLKQFSDGQFQSVYIYSLLEIFKSKNCLIMLDEPDSFLHPEWQFEFLRQINNISDDSSKNHVLMTSHSAATLINFPRPKVAFFDLKDNHANCYLLPKNTAIKKLSSDLIRYSEQQQLLSVIYTIQFNSKPILFTEGSTDPVIIRIAWERLYDEEMPFIPFYAFSCTYLKQLLTDERIKSELSGRPIFGLFDFDLAYNQWNGIKGVILQSDPFLGLTKKWDGGDSYAFMLPIPPDATIQNQTIKNMATKTTYEGDSHCEIEHYFFGEHGTEPFFTTETAPGGGQIICFNDSSKTDFACKIVPTMPRKCFEPFLPIFQFIKSIIR